MYLCSMFPRKKKNRTGTISVVVVDKSRGGFKEVKNFGVAKTEEEADRLYTKPAGVVEWMLAQEKVSGTYHEYTRKNGGRLIIGYSERGSHLHLLHRIQGLQGTTAHHRPARGNQPQCGQGD